MKFNIQGGAFLKFAIDLLVKIFVFFSYMLSYCCKNVYHTTVYIKLLRLLNISFLVGAEIV